MFVPSFLKRVIIWPLDACGIVPRGEPRHLGAARRRGRIGLLLCIALLSGCSLLRLTYPQAPTLTYWWLDGYIDFTNAQTPRVQEQMADWLRWHRATQLPDYAQLLQRARTEVLANTTPAQVCRWYEELAARGMTALEQALPAAAETALGLTPAQMEHIRRKFDKTNVEFRKEFMQANLATRQKENYKRALERSEKFYGRLDDAQRESLARSVAASPFDAALWQAEREQQQRDLLQTLRRLQTERADGAQAQAALRTLAEQALNSPRPAYAAYAQRLREYGCESAAELHNSTTPAQRKEAADMLKGYEMDVRALAAEPAR